MSYWIGHEGCLHATQRMAENSVDAVVTDPPYGLSREPDIAEVLTKWLAGEDYHHRGGGFMGKSWDSFVPGPATWREAYRVLKPGGYLLAFAGTRTADLMGISLRMAGFEIRDRILYVTEGGEVEEHWPVWCYGSGMPKSHDVSKAIDKAAGVTTRPAVGEKRGADVLRRCAPDGARFGDGRWGDEVGRDPFIRGAVTPEAKEWEGWGTALKPAHEPIIVARKPLEGTVAQNVLRWGTGAMNIDACRVPTNGDKLGGGAENSTRQDQKNTDAFRRPWMNDAAARACHAERVRDNVVKAEQLGRWPANVIHDGSAAVVADFPMAKGQQGRLTGDEPSGKMGAANCYGKMDRRHAAEPRGDSGSAARFFHAAGEGAAPANGRAGEASAERRYTEKGGTNFAATPGARREPTTKHRLFYSAKAGKRERDEGLPEGMRNTHSTVKPIALMRYLCRLVTPPGGTVLDPFAGSGTTGVAALREGFRFVGMEQDEEAHRIASWRLYSAYQKMNGAEAAS